MSVLPVGISGEAGAYQIERSLRFDSSASAYLNRTPASASNRKTWTWSGWVKRGTLGTTQYVFCAGASAVNFEFLGFSGDNVYYYRQLSSVADAELRTNAVLRDPSAWYHIVVSVNAASTVAKIYVNGVEQSLSISDQPSNVNGPVNNTEVQTIGNRSWDNSSYFNGYLTEINFIDGQALTPSSFGEFNSDTGVWQPIKYTGTYGTNGFYLPFSDNASTTTLGDDFSGNGNDWTTNNFSVTAGAGNDSLVDSPTRYGTDTGAGGEVRGNYATLNPLNNASSLALANGNLDTSRATASWASIRATFGMTSGKWYWEVTPTSGLTIGSFSNQIMIGISLATASSSLYYDSASGWGYYFNDGNKWNNNSGSAYGNSFTNNDVIGIALDADNGDLYFYKNGVVQNSGTPAFTGLTSGPYFPTHGLYGTCAAVSNFGQRPFAYTAPSGFKALVTTNLPTPTIEDGSQYFDVALYTTNGSAQTITTNGNGNALQFTPDFLWNKGRNLVQSHYLANIVTGLGNTLSTDTTAAEAATGLFTAVSQGSFSMASEPAGRTKVTWLWKANGAGVSNTAGTITSTVSVNTTSGFSIVTYTGNGSTSSTQTIGHGLGVKPAFIITKNRDSGTAGPGYWSCWHKDLGGTNAGIWLDLTNARNNSMWTGQANISTTVFVPPDLSYGNVSGNKYVNYVFAPVAGYSAFGSYTGNGSADGPFVYTGFRPRYVLVKCSSAGSTNWVLHDTAREPYNLATASLYPNLSNAETVAASQSMDILSNGFKLRNISGDINTSSATYIFAAFAENPVKYSLGR